jgi:hypothetical protein
MHALRSEGYYELIAKGVDGILMEVERFAFASEDAERLEVRELLHYILYEHCSEKKYVNGIRDHRRGPINLSNFMANQKVVQAGLREAEVVAMRLYTTMAYKFMNNPLRDDNRYDTGRACPLPVATHFAAEGAKKLRALHVDSGATTLWRGLRNLEAADDFMQKGGTELGFMSTTRDLDVAVRYCLSSHSLIFKLDVQNFMTMGADVQWLSAFPDEAEILYPPLTYLKPTGRTESLEVDTGSRKLTFSIVEVAPQLS